MKAFRIAIDVCERGGERERAEEVRGGTQRQRAEGSESTCVCLKLVTLRERQQKYREREMVTQKIRRAQKKVKDIIEKDDGIHAGSIKLVALIFL